MGSKLITNLTNFLATGIALWITSSLFNGFSFETIESLVLCSILLTLINIFVKPIVFLLALPLAIFTLGLIIPIIYSIVDKKLLAENEIIIFAPDFPLFWKVET